MAPNRLGFLIHSPELLNHYGCVMDLLPPGSFDLVLCGDAEADPTLPGLAQRWHAGLVLAEEVIRSGDLYPFLVSNHPFRTTTPPFIKQVAHRNIRFMYAAGKSGWNLSSWNRDYDLILCYGPFHALAFAEFCEAPVLQVGYPRFDRFFTEPAERAELQARFGCDPGKPTVVWLPTWSSLSSVGRFDEEIAALTTTHNVVVKVHPLMPGSEPDKVALAPESSGTPSGSRFRTRPTWNCSAASISENDHEHRPPSFDPRRRPRFPHGSPHRGTAQVLHAPGREAPPGLAA